MAREVWVPVLLGRGRRTVSGTMALMSRVGSDVESRASTAQLRKARRELLELAARHHVSDLRLTDDGTLVLHVDDDNTYRPVLKFVDEVTRFLGAEPHVVTDDAPALGRLHTTPL